MDGPAVDDGDDSPADDSAVLAREAAAAAEAGDSRRADALICARALLAENGGDEAGARALWRSAFDRDPTLLVAFWGLRRALSRRGAWDELLAAVERRIAAIVSPDQAGVGGALGNPRAELWLEHGRLLEDRLGRDDEAARSYRAGLLETPDHPALLTSLLLLGFRRGDSGATAEALSGLLRRSLPLPLRASLSAFLARIERSGSAAPAGPLSPSSGGAAPSPPPPPLDPAGAQRALETLRDGLRAVGPENAAPLVAELSVLARAARDPATRVEILDELATHLPGLDGAGAGEGGSSVEDGVGNRELAAAFLRERARLLRDHLEQPDAARTSLRAALLLVPAHPVVLAELADLIEAGAGPRAEVAARELTELLAAVAPDDRPLDREPARELAVRTLTALAAAGRWQDGLELLERHPELPRHRADLFALELLLRAGAGDRARLAVLFETLADDLTSRPATAQAAAHALVVAGTLREREQGGGQGGVRAQPGRGHPTDQRFAGGTARGDDAEAAALRLYGRALQLVPGYAPAHDAVERQLWAAGRWKELGAVLEHRLRQVAASPPSAGGSETNAVSRQMDDASAERTQILEELVALHRDRAVDLTAARRHQDQLIAETTAGRDVRAWARRYDLELNAAANNGAAGAAPTDTGAVVRALADQVDGPSPAASAVASALRVEAARIAAHGGDRALAGELLRQAVPSDLAGTATSALERLLAVDDDQRENPQDAHTESSIAVAVARADLVRTELAGVLARESTGSNGTGKGNQNGTALSANAERVRGLRFRVAWHELAAHRPAAALDILRPLRASGDMLARAWSWEIARRHGDPQAQLAVLQSVPPGPHSGLIELPTDLAEALERAGDLPAAEAGFREAQRKEASTEAALGLLRVGAALGNASVVLEAARDLAAQADPSTVGLLSQEVALLALLQPEAEQPIPETAPAGPAGGAGEQRGDAVLGSDADSDVEVQADTAEADPMKVVLRWVAGTRGTDVLAAASSLLALARALPNRNAPSESVADRNGLLARAAARARLGGVALAGAVHDQAVKLSAGAAPIGVGLADQPVAGRPERMAARVARAERNGGPLAYALDLERALDCESRGDAPGALQAFAQALRRDPEGLEALDGIKRLALSTGDRLGAARAGARLGVVLRTPARAAAELGMAAQLWEDLAMPAEAAIAYWQALARNPASEWLYERLRQVLLGQGDAAALDRLYGHRLAALTDPRARLTLLWERAQHRLEQLQDRKGAIEDFKRILNIDPGHPLALRRLATLAVQMEYFPQAVRFLERLLEEERDDEGAAALRLELAEVHEAARDVPRAIEVLRRAASARPRDASPWQRLTDLLLRIGDWSGALATLRSWDAVLADPGARAIIWLRIGRLLRDHGRDTAGAAASFITASELDPLGDGLGELLALAPVGGTTAPAPQREALRNAMVALRQRVAEDPLDVRTLRRLKELCEWSAGDDSRDAVACAAVAGQLLSLAGEDADLFPGRRRELRGLLPVGFWSRLRAPGGTGFVAELWPTLAAAITRLAPPGAPALNARERQRIPPRSEPRLAWVESAAAAVGLPGLDLWMATAASSARKGTTAASPATDLADESVVALDGEEAGLLLGRGVLTGNATARFRVGRALLLLRERATVMERLSVEELGTFMAAAARLVGTAALDAPGTLTGIDERARAIGKAMTRKERKALESQASRFATEPADPGPFRHAQLATADRLGLVLAGDIAVAVRVAGEFVLDPEVPLTSAALAASPHRRRLLELVRFAVSDDYSALRRDASLEEG